MTRMVVLAKAEFGGGTVPPVRRGRSLPRRNILDAAAGFSPAGLFRRDNPVPGNPGRGLTIVEHLGYQCPFCKRGHSMLTNVAAADGTIRLVMKRAFRGSERFACRVLGPHRSTRAARRHAGGPMKRR